jgi:hypothetical protein
VVVDEEDKNRTNKTTLKSEWRSALKKKLTEPALLEMSGNPPNQELTWRCRAGWLVKRGIIGDLRGVSCTR